MIEATLRRPRNARKRTRAEEERSRRIVGGHTGTVESPTEPAQAASFFGVEAGCVPNGHGLEMRAIGIGIADTLDDGEPAFFEQLGHLAQGRVQTDLRIDLHDVAGWQAKTGAVLGITFVGERHDGVDSVVAAIELEHHEDAAFRLRPGRPAVCARNDGTVGARARSVAFFRKSRRF